MCHDNQHGEAPSTVGASYVDPSATELLTPGTKVSGYFKRNLTTPYFVQRLTQRTYFFGGGFYTTTFYVGDAGVLVLDPPERQGENLLHAIAEVTSLPVTAIVYSHDHADHLVGAAPLLEAASAAGNEVRIVASTETTEKMIFLDSSLPRPTETVTWPAGSFEFEGLKIQFDGFTRASHTDDAGAWLLVQEKVVHLPDLVNPDEPPFRDFAVSDNYVYYRSNVNQLGALDWDHLVGGHGNVGSKDDIRFYNTFLDDIEAAVGKAMAVSKFAEGEDLEKYDNHAILMVMWLDQVTGMVTDELRPKYGKFYGFEISTPANAEKITQSMIAYR
jgi:glyoxylase-like metal-dependent hydrolase (beta-lactamase superfamily II)